VTARPPTRTATATPTRTADRQTTHHHRGELMTTPLPTHITPGQIVAACEALGLDPMRVTAFHADLHTVVVTRWAVDKHGRQLPLDHPAVTETTVIPIAYDATTEESR
jgi:hypothetical protein